MLRKTFHLSDHELTLWIDGELSLLRAARARRHLQACWTCRARLAELDQIILDFVRVYRQEDAGDLPPMEAARARFQARLAEIAAVTGSPKDVWAGRIRLAAALVVTILVALTATTMLRSRHLQTFSVGVRVGPSPDLSLTPGATKPVSVQNVCSAQFETNDPAVPDSLKREVLKTYGLTSISDRGYEIDYLVAPELGGVDNIRNLWPEPTLNTVWNAHVKDALEDRLHSLVCDGQLDLLTAQRDISRDWIAAYKKYFHTNQPLPEHLGGKAIDLRKRGSRFSSVLLIARPFMLGAHS